jgi:hypothetical protein
VEQQDGEDQDAEDIAAEGITVAIVARTVQEEAILTQNTLNPLPPLLPQPLQFQERIGTPIERQLTVQQAPQQQQAQQQAQEAQLSLLMRLAQQAKQASRRVN